MQLQLMATIQSAKKSFSVTISTLDGRSTRLDGVSADQKFAEFRAVAETAVGTPRFHVLKLFLGDRALEDFEDEGTVRSAGVCPDASLTGVLCVAPLKRVLGWTASCSPGQTGAGDVATIVDLGRDPGGMCWWTSWDAVFMGRWVQAARGVHREPSPARGKPPELTVVFSEPVVLRGVAMIARNVPREVEFVAEFMGRAEVRTMEFQPNYDDVIPWSEEYMGLVREEISMDGLTPPEVYERHTSLPRVFQEPLECERLRLRLLSCHEGGWVGINHLVFFG